MIKVKRAYEPVSRTDGARFLVERLWPRGILKAKLPIDAWLKEVGPVRSCGSGSVTIPRSGANFGTATSVSSTRDRKPGSPSCRRRGAAASRSSMAHTIHSTTMRSPCKSTSELNRAGRPSQGGWSRRTAGTGQCIHVLDGSPPRLILDSAAAKFRKRALA